MTPLERPLGSGSLTKHTARREAPAPSTGIREGASSSLRSPGPERGRTPQHHAAHSTVTSTRRLVPVEPPSGGDSSAPTRSAAPRVAPAPVRAIARIIVPAALFFFIHAAATNIWTALAFAATVLTLTAVFATRR